MFDVKSGTPVNQDSTARVGSVSIMSNPVLQITTGSNEARRLNAGDVVPSEEAVSLEEISRHIGKVAESTNALITELRQEMPGLTDEARTALANVNAHHRSGEPETNRGNSRGIQLDPESRVAQDRANHRSDLPVGQTRGLRRRFSQTGHAQHRQDRNERQQHGRRTSPPAHEKHHGTGSARFKKPARCWRAYARWSAPTNKSWRRRCGTCVRPRRISVISARQSSNDRGISFAPHSHPIERFRSERDAVSISGDTRVSRNTRARRLRTCSLSHELCPELPAGQCPDRAAT